MTQQNRRQIGVMIDVPGWRVRDQRYGVTWSQIAETGDRDG